MDQNRAPVKRRSLGSKGNYFTRWALDRCTPVVRRSHDGRTVARRAHGRPGSPSAHTPVARPSYDGRTVARVHRALVRPSYACRTPVVRRSPKFSHPYVSHTCLYVTIVRILIDLTSRGSLGFPTALPPIKYHREDGIPWESLITRATWLPPGAPSHQIPPGG